METIVYGDSNAINDFDYMGYKKVENIKSNMSTNARKRKVEIMSCE